MVDEIFQKVRFGKGPVEPVLDGVPDINIRAMDGRNLLHAAVIYGNFAAVNELIRRGIDLNAQDSKGQTPLHYAISNNHPEAVRRILEAGGDVSIADVHGNTPVWTAVFNSRGNYEFVDEVLNHGGARLVGDKNKHGRSPLDFATQIGDAELIGRMQH